MSVRSVAAPVWSGFLLSTLAFFSYPFFFARFPITRDFPWVNLLLFAAAAGLLIVGWRRAFAAEGSRRARIGTAIGVVATGLVLAAFVLAIFIGGRRLPSSPSAPKMGQKAPEFQLTDTNGKMVSLSELLTAPLNGQAPKGVLLVFYRGYW